MDTTLSWLLVLVPALPLAGAVLCAALGPVLLGRHSHWPVILAVVLSFGASAYLLHSVWQAQRNMAEAADAGERVGFEQTVTLWTWAAVPDAYQMAPPVGASPSDRGWRDFRIDVTLRLDALTAMMLTTVTFISSLIVIYSAGYMAGDRGYWRFFAYMGLFVFSMTMLVSVSNFALLYVFWEAVGVCSYLLIGFWYEKPEAAAAGKKAFLVNRVGDFGFALALFLIWTTYGTLNFHDTHAAAGGVAEQAAAGEVVAQGVLGQERIASDGYVGGAVGLAICLLLMLGACGKSAQFPLHVWLPDAMEGPTPVSALIHAATMVTAGVYMVARCTPLFMASPPAQLVVACIGAFTALLAALIALTQFDLKRVLAYSTISQLGYMFLGLGAGTFLGITSGLFHLFTHAFFKALLFLGAGSVMHAMGNVIDMRRFGGLRKLMPVTHATFFIGCLALAGLPPFSGFWSKDSIMASVEEKAHQLQHGDLHGEAHRGAGGEAEGAEGHAPGGSLWPAAAGHIYQWLYYSAVLTAFLTAFYAFRAFYLTFYGDERVPHEAGHHAHESPPVMWWPLVILALGAALAGFCFDRTYLQRGATHYFAEFLSFTPSLAGGAVAATKSAYAFHVSVAGMSVAVALGGLLLATYLYLGDDREIRVVKSLFDLEDFLAWLDRQQAFARRRSPALENLRHSFGRVGLAWILSLLEGVAVLLVLVLAAPLLLAKFVSPYKLSSAKFYFDELYYVTVVLPLRGLAELCYAADRWVVDGAVNLVGWIPRAAGSLMRSLQMGLIQFYALAMFLGVLVLLAARLIWNAG